MARKMSFPIGRCIDSGLIGRSWSILFSSFGYQVQLFDSNKDSQEAAIGLIRSELTELCSKNLAPGSLGLEERLALISNAATLEDCLHDAWYIQECVFDDLELKQKIFKEVDDILDENNNDTLICSSTSVLLPSKVFAMVEQHKSQCLVAHPVNPPLFVRLVELVPSPHTREDLLIRARLLMDEIGQKPAILRKEVSGFALNRLQFAVFQEAFRLIRDGVMSASDVDVVVSDGLGPRYAFMGPWMTAHLNANGVGDYFDKYGKGIYNVSLECQPALRLEGEAAQQVVDSMLREVPLDKLKEKRAWRDRCLIKLAELKKQIDKE